MSSEPVSVLARQVRDALRTGAIEECPEELRPLLTELYAMHRKMLANWVPLGEFGTNGKPLEPGGDCRHSFIPFLSLSCHFRYVSCLSPDLIPGILSGKVPR